LGVDDPNRKRPQARNPDSLKERLIRGTKAVAIATIAASGVILGIRQLGWLQRFELVSYDRMVQLSADQGPDSRLLLVGITEENLRELQRGTPSDASIAEAIQNLQQHDPRAIGLDLYRDLPQEPGNEALLQALDAPNVIAIMNLGTSSNDLIPAPPGVPEERIGFNDFPIDADGVVRRSLLIGTTEDGNAHHSFSLRLAMAYLTPLEIFLKNNPDDPNEIQLGDVPIPRLTPYAGGYDREDAAGYQIVLDYRSPYQVAPFASFIDVLEGDVDPRLIEDKVVVIGTVAESSRDFFPTPYSAGRSENFEMAGVTVHTHMVSQLIDVALQERSLIWFLPEWGEIMWIVVCAAAGGTVALFLRHPITLGIGSMALVLGISGTAFFMFAQQAWIPVIAPAIAALLSGGIAVTYRAYTAQQEHDAVTEFLKQNSPETLFKQKN
jgi:CHASE2 domain-containing sensor protein